MQSTFIHTCNISVSTFKHLLQYAACVKKWTRMIIYKYCTSIWRNYIHRHNIYTNARCGHQISTQPSKLQREVLVPNPWDWQWFWMRQKLQWAPRNSSHQKPGMRQNWIELKFKISKYGNHLDISGSPLLLFDAVWSNYIRPYQTCGCSMLSMFQVIDYHDRHQQAMTRTSAAKATLHSKSFHRFK